ncbi:MAG: TolC family protein/Multidrug resistance, efflux pump (AcrEF-TolC, MdtEF-TolC) [Treponematales bacterium]
MKELCSGQGKRGKRLSLPAVFLGLACGLGPAFPAAAQDAAAAKTLSVEEAVELAVRNNLTLAAERVSLDTKARKNKYKWNLFIPTVTATGTVSRPNEVVDQMEELRAILPAIPPAATDPTWRLIGGLSAEITITPALFEGLKSIRLDYQAGLLSLEKAKTQVERDVRKAYNTILLAEESLRVQREGLALAQRQTEQARASFRAGLAPDLTYLQAQVAEANKMPAIDEAENNVRLAKAQFAYTLGLPYGTEITLVRDEGEFSYAALDTGSFIAQARESRPDILALRQNLKTLQSQRKSKQLQIHTPALRLAWNTQPVFSGNPWDDVGKWFTSDNWTDSSGAFSFTLAFGLNAFVPLFQEWQGIKDLDNQIESTRIGLSQLVQGTEIEVYNTVLSLEKTEASIEALRKTVDLAERSYNATVAAYRAGSQTLLETQNAEDQLRQARLGVLAQEFNYRNGLIDLEYAAGVPFGTLSVKENKEVQK